MSVWVIRVVKSLVKRHGVVWNGKYGMVNMVLRHDVHDYLVTPSLHPMHTHDITHDTTHGNTRDTMEYLGYRVCVLGTVEKSIFKYLRGVYGRSILYSVSTPHPVLRTRTRHTYSDSQSILRTPWRPGNNGARGRVGLSLPGLCSLVYRHSV